MALSLLSGQALRFTTPPPGQEAFYAQTLVQQQRYQFRQKVYTAIVTVVVLAGSCALAALVGWFFYVLEAPTFVTHVGRAKFVVASGLLVLRDSGGVELLRGTLGEELQHGLMLEGFCEQRSAHSLCVQLQHNITLSLKHEHRATQDCYHIHWHSPSCRHTELKDCFIGTLGSWFGGSSSHLVAPNRSEWANKRWTRTKCVITQNVFEGDTVFVSSHGYWLRAEGNIELTLKEGDWCSDHFVCIGEQGRGGLGRGEAGLEGSAEGRHLSYTVCVNGSGSEELASTHNSSNSKQQAASDTSHLSLLHHPILPLPSLDAATLNWTQLYHTLSHSGTQSVLYLCHLCDDINNGRHPTVAMETSMRGHDVRHGHGSIHIALPVHPFTDVSAILQPSTSTAGSPLDLVLRDANNVPLFFTWDNSTSFMLNFSRTQARHQFLQKLHSFQERQPEFKIKALLVSGDVEAAAIKAQDSSHKDDMKSMIRQNLELFYEVVHREFAHLPIVSGAGSELSAELQLMAPLRPVWGAGGLEDLLPRALIASLSSPTTAFISPAVIGQRLSCDPAHPPISEELFLRWLQAVSLFPVIQLPASPWCYKDNIQQYVQKLVSTHQAYVPKMKASLLAEPSRPLIQPVWMLSGEPDADSFGVSDQYLMGQHVMVAPILQPGASHRDIYLPRLQRNGFWWDNLRQDRLAGAQWLTHYQAGSYEVPHFTVMWRTAD